MPAGNWQRNYSQPNDYCGYDVTSCALCVHTTARLKLKTECALTAVHVLHAMPHVSKRTMQHAWCLHIVVRAIARIQELQRSTNSCIAPANTVFDAACRVDQCGCPGIFSLCAVCQWSWSHVADDKLPIQMCVCIVRPHIYIPVLRV